MRSFLLACICLCACAAGESDVPAEGRIIMGDDRVVEPVFVFTETLDGARYAIDSPDSPATDIPRARYKRIEYAQAKEVPYLKGLNALAADDLATAQEQLQKATTSRWAWVREDAWLRLAELHLAAKRPADAIAAVDSLLKAVPRTVRVARAQWLRGSAQAAAGDSAGAVKTFAELAGKAKEWGEDAEVLGLRGQASALAAAKKPADAATVLQPLWGKLVPAKSPEAFAAVGGELAGYLATAGDKPKAIAAYERLALNLADNSGRSRARLELARLLLDPADPKTLFTAYDQAVIAANLAGADPAVADAAGALARQIVAKIDKLPTDLCSDAEKAEYRRYR